MKTDVNAASVDRVVHTPGPWRQGGVKELMLNNKCREIVADKGRIGLVYGTTDKDCKANARLIESSPEMFRIIQRLATADWIGEAELNLWQKECREIMRKVV